MRILLQTQDPITESRFLHAAQTQQKRQISVLHSEAQVLERLFRDPFDALIADAQEGRSDLAEVYAPFCPKNLFLLLPAPPMEAPLPTAVVCGFLHACAADTVLKRVEMLSGRAERPKPQEQTLVSKALQHIGVPVHLKGFPLLKEAIRLSLHLTQPTALRMTEDIYELLAEGTGTNVSIVEHAIRHAIEAAWLRADARVVERMFGYTVSEERVTPSNAAFLFQMREHILLLQNGRGSI